jgi:hypothetical protein
LAEAADPTAAALVLLLVDVELDFGGEGGVAGFVLLAGSTGEEGLIAGSVEGDLPPGGGGGDGDGTLEARALNASNFGDGGTLGERAFMEGDRALVTHILVGTVSAIFNTIAALGVGDTLLVGADEMSFGARTSGVVASRGEDKSIDGLLLSRNESNNE